MFVGAWLRRENRFGDEFLATIVVLSSAFFALVFALIAATALQHGTDAFDIGVAAIFIVLALFELFKAGGFLFIFVTRREELHNDGP